MMRDRRFKFVMFVCCMAVTLLLADPMAAYAGDWQQSEDGRYWYGTPGADSAVGWKELDGEWYYFDPDGWMLTGWIEADGFWYCLDSVTGVWNEQPDINKDTVGYLMENAFRRAGLYQNEESEVIVKVERGSGAELVASVGTEERPGVYRSFNTYTIDRSKRTATPSIRGDVLTL